MRVRDLPDGPESRRCLELRAQLGIAAGPDAPAFVAGDGDSRVCRAGAAVAADGAADRDEPRGKRRDLPVALAIPPRAGGRRRGGKEMKAARLHEYHQPLKLESVDEPKADGPFDVIVRIGAAGLCRTDLHIQEGQWAEKSGVTLPYTPGHENAGWVHEIGSGVSNVEVGDTVIVHPFISCGLCGPCRRGDDMHCLNGSFPGIDRDGGFADFLQTSARSVVKLDSGARAQGHRRARRRRADRDPRRQEGDPGAGRRDQGRGDRRGRARTHRDPVPEGVHARGDHRDRPVREGARAGQGGRRRSHRQGRRRPGQAGPGADRRVAAPRRSSTSSARRARSRTGSRWSATAASTT